ncbi:MAG: nucleotidyl transferase AbiEii/AbiGii toxin family protein [Pseudomonadota bacterium]
MKDFYDLAVIARRTALDGKILSEAIAATFARRGTPLPAERPLALTREFGQDSAKLRQWQAFLNKSRVEAPALPHVVTLLGLLLWPPSEAARDGGAFDLVWAYEDEDVRQWKAPMPGQARPGPQGINPPP